MFKYILDWRNPCFLLHNPIQDYFIVIYTGLSETWEVNLNGDDKRFWLGRLENINDNKMNNFTSLNPEFFAEKFELNDDL